MAHHKDLTAESVQQPQDDGMTKVSPNLAIYNGRSPNLIVRRSLQNGSSRVFYIEPTVLNFLAELEDRFLLAFSQQDDFIVKRPNVGVVYFSISNNSTNPEAWMNVRPVRGPAFNLRRQEFSNLIALLPWIRASILIVSIFYIYEGKGVIIFIYYLNYCTIMLKWYDLYKKQV